MAKDHFEPPANGTDQRLDAILAELRGLRNDLAPAAQPAPKDGDTVELREPAKPPKRKQGSPP